jgi:dephospho-CoA kinase
VLVVETDEEVRVQRLLQRGLSADDARARIASQATDAQRREVADVVLRNDGDRDALAAQVDRFWAEHVATAPG